jgi:hypothetical protein
MSEIRIKIKIFSIPENNSEVIFLSIVFSRAESQFENLHFSDSEATNEIFIFRINFSGNFRNSDTIN